jgi:general secretion pathway protein C
LRFARDQLVVAGRRLPPVSLHDVLWWALAATIALLAAILLWIVVTPVSPLGNWQPASVRVMSPAARSALFASLDPFNRGGTQVAAATGPGAVTSLPLTLFGIRVNAATGGGSAIIAGSDGIQQVYRVGTEVMPGVTLVGVHFDHVELSQNGSKELLYLDQSKPAANAATALAASSAGPVGQTGPAAPPQGPLTADALRQGIALQPFAEGGRITGLVVDPGSNSGAFQAAGFRSGDVITGIGGKRVTSASDGSALMSSLRPGSSVSVTVRRDGRELPLAITVPR